MLRSVLALFCLLLLFSPPEAKSQPNLLWWHDLNAPSFGSAATADIDGDSLLEIVFGTYFNDEHVYALNADDGSLLWSYDTGGCNDASPVIFDVDQDGELEVIIPASSPCRVYCFNGATGIVEWSFNTYPHSLDSPPAVGDLDNDGRPEIVFGAFHGYVYCLNGEDGSSVWQINLGTNSYIQTDPQILDCNSDGQLDVIVAQWAGDERIYALRGDNGSVLWYSDLPEDYMYHGASFADIDEDNLPELVIGSYDGDLYVLDAENGSLVWEYPGILYIGGPTSVADLNRDGHLEIVFASYTTLKVLSHTGALLWSYGTGGSIFRGAAICDVNGDQTLDVVCASDDGILRALRGNNGSLIWSMDLEAHYGRTFPMDHAPVLADFNNDDSLDVFIVGGYGSSSQPSNNYGRAYALTAGAGNGPGWPMFRHDPVHSGSFFPPAHAVEIALTPISPPIQIPSNGGSFDFNAILTNNETVTVPFQIWIKVQLPNGAWYGPVLGPINLILPGSAILTRLRTQSVPGNAPAGDYIYRGYVGAYAAKWDSSSFSFEKMGAGDLGSGAGGWANSGEDFTTDVGARRAAPASGEGAARCAPTLQPPVPNPFNPTTVIRFYLPVAGLVRLDLFDIKGRRVGVGLVPTRPYPAGPHEITFCGSGLPSGIYFAKLIAGEHSQVQKMILMK